MGVFSGEARTKEVFPFPEGIYHDKLFFIYLTLPEQQLTMKQICIPWTQLKIVK